MNIKNNKKAAMFGLDARIALAIFGALSVISGAALYKAVQKANIVRYAAFYQEFAKAYEAFYLDTGTHVSKACYLANNNPAIPGWQGPYLGEYISVSSDCSTGSVKLKEPFEDKNIYNTVGTNASFLWEGHNATWADIGTFITNNQCPSDPTTTNGCSKYYKMSMIDSGFNQLSDFTDFADALDEYIDNGDGSTKGDFRYGIHFNSYVWAYRIMPIN